MLGSRRFLGALREQLERLFDAVEDRQGRIDSILVELSARLEALRAEREPLQLRSASLQRAVELSQRREQHQRSAARQALADPARALECLRRAHLAGHEAARLAAQHAALQPLQAALDAELQALEQRVEQLRALREQLRARQAVVELDSLRRTTLANDCSGTPVGSLPALLARWESQLSTGEASRDLAKWLDSTAPHAWPAAADTAADADADLERALRAELAQLLEEP
jgi:phage shock protein A